MGRRKKCWPMRQRLRANRLVPTSLLRANLERLPAHRPFLARRKPGSSIHSELEITGPASGMTE